MVGTILRSLFGPPRGRGPLAAAGLAPTLLAAVLLASCTTTDLASNRTGWSDYATIATKDYAVVGIVRVVSEEVTQRGFLGVANSRKGSEITYDLLIAEAKRLGADDVINVRVDRTDASLHGTFDWLFGYTEKCTYTANALAIRYTKAVAGSRADYRRPVPGVTSGLAVSAAPEPADTDPAPAAQ